MARLILATANGPQAIELRPVNSLGRHPNNSIQLLDKIVSKEHCIIEQRAGDFVLRDLGSLNGTYINDNKVRGEQVLHHGDEIALGTTHARFDDGSSPIAMPSGSGPGAITQDPTASGTASSVPQAEREPKRPRTMAGQGPAIPSSVRASSRPQPPAAASISGLSPPLPPARLPQPTQQRAPTFTGTRVDVLDSARKIGAQIDVTLKSFLPFNQIHDAQQLGGDYERLRIMWELTRDIGQVRDLDMLLQKILLALFKFVNADRGCILLKEEDGSLQARAAHRRDGSDKPIEVSSTILNHVTREKAAVLTHDGMDFASAAGPKSKSKSMIMNRITSAMVAPLAHEDKVLGVLWLDSESLAQFTAKDLEVLTSVANQAAMFVANMLLAKQVEREIVKREYLKRLLSPNVAERVLSGSLKMELGGTLVPECTVFNSDIRGFTPMSEGASAEAMVVMLNEYFELMVETIFRHDGTLDKFMGDGIMAFWGAPAAHPEDAIRAVQCALEQMDVLGQYNRQRVSRGAPPIPIGVGLHTGPVVAGYVGSLKTLSYTVIGDTANTSARLCGIAASGQIIVSENTLAKLGARFEVEELPPAQLKGKERPSRIYNVVREKPTAASMLPTNGSYKQIL